MYLIILKTNGAYTHTDFLTNDFLASHYFLLLELLEEHITLENKAKKRANNRK